MRNPKRIFIIGDFYEHSATVIRTERYHWLKGFARIGHDFQHFSYKNIMMQLSPLKSKTIAKMFAKNYTDKLLAAQVKQYHPDIIFILTMKDLDADTVDVLKEVAPNSFFVGRDNDWHPEKNPSRMAIAKKMDTVIATNAGEWLRFYKSSGVPCCAFMPNPCDPDIQRPYDDKEGKYKADIIFTGKALHSKNENDLDRSEILKRLSKMPNVRIYGEFGNPKIGGIESFKAISNAKIGLSINSANNVRLYHSDRFIMYLSCGTFVLAKRVPDSELLFKDGVHLRYFDTAEEFFELADWYLKHDQEREKIAKAGMERAHSEFNCERIAKLTLDLIEKGSYDAPWSVIF
jgi:spore maturation protein CgeB